MSSSGALRTCLILTLVVFCLGVLLASWGVIKMFSEVELAYGPPEPGLETLDRIILSARLWLQTEDLKSPQDVLGANIPFQVKLGESTFQVTERLEAEGFIPDAEALRDYLVYSGLDKTLQAGEYTLSSKMTPLEIAHTLQDATPGEITFRVLPGWRMEEIAAALPTSGLSFTPQAFLAIADNPPPLSTIVAALPSGATLEGFLYPDSYLFPREIPADGFVRILLEDFEIKVNRDIREGFERQGLDLFQGVTLASIVQREAVVPDEMPLIASVFLNRLAIGMKLESDATVQYAMGYIPTQESWWKNPLSLDDLKTDSPYNTYLHPVLPPGPINNPSLHAMQAVAYPAQTPYYYFRATCDGSGRHSFAETFEEHKQNQCPEVED